MSSIDKFRQDELEKVNSVMAARSVEEMINEQPRYAVLCKAFDQSSISP
jgi:hypothetical protein